MSKKLNVGKVTQIVQELPKKGFLRFLDGKKTYIVSALSLVLAGLSVFGVLNQDQYEQLIAFLAPLGFIALRAGVKK